MLDSSSSSRGDGGALPGNRERGDVIGGRLDQQREERERREAPAPGHGAGDGEQDDQGYEDRGAELRADFGDRVEGAGAVVGEGRVEALVRVAEPEPAVADQPVDDEMAEQDRGDEEQQQAPEQRQREDESGVAVAEGGREAFRVAPGARGERRSSARFSANRHSPLPSPIAGQSPQGQKGLRAKLGPGRDKRRSYHRPMRFLLARAVSAALVIAVAMAFSSRADAAPSWIAPTTLGPTGREGGAPEVAVAPDGEAIATWVGSRPNGIQVSSRRPGKGWSPPVTIAPVREEVEGPQVAVSAGKAVIVWTDNVRTRSGSARVVLAATRLRGKRWSKPRNISADKRWRFEPEGEEPQVAMTRRGKAIVVWSASNEGHSTTSFVGSATQAAAATNWTGPVGLRGSYEAEEPQVVTTPAGEAVAIWGASYNEESAISVSSRPPEGPWKGAGRLSTPGTFPQLQLAITSQGEAVGAWVEEPEEGFGTVVRVATRPSGGKWKVKTLAPQDFGASPEIVTEPGGRAQVVWAQGASFAEQTIVASTHASGGAWSEPMSLAGEGLQLPAVSESPIAVTPGGESIALWASASSSGERSSIYSSSRPRGQPWSPPTEISTSPAGPLYGAPGLQLAIAPDGGAFAVWRCFDGTRWVIKAATRPAAGAES